MLNIAKRSDSENGVTSHQSAWASLQSTNNKSWKAVEIKDPPILEQCVGGIVSLLFQ